MTAPSWPKQGHTVVVTIQLPSGSSRLHVAIRRSMPKAIFFSNYGILGPAGGAPMGEKTNIRNFGGDEGQRYARRPVGGLRVDTESNVISPLAKGTLPPRDSSKAFVLEGRCLSLRPKQHGVAFAVCGPAAAPVPMPLPPPVCAA